MPNLSEHSIFLTNNMIYHQHRKQALKVLFCFFHLQCLISPPILVANKKSVLQDSGETSNSRIDRFRIHSETLSSRYTLKGRSYAGPSGQNNGLYLGDPRDICSSLVSWKRRSYSSFSMRQRLVREIPSISAAFDLLPPSISMTCSA